MRRRGWLVASILTIGVIWSAWPVWSEEPATTDPSGADPASEIIENLIEQLRSAPNRTAPAESTESAEPAAAPPKQAKRSSTDGPTRTDKWPAAADEILDEVAAREAEVLSRKARNAEILFMQARAAEEAGKLSEAIRLAGSARRLDPTNREIVEYYQQLEKGVGRTSVPTYAKATAHLAAGLTRGQLLLEQGRHAAGMDLLEGVVQACDLFPTEARVEFYRRLAERLLEETRRQIKEGTIELDEKPADEPEPILVATGSSAPANAKRILRIVEEETPAWYSDLKSRLAFLMNVDYREESVGLVLEEIAKATGVNIIIDEPVLRSRIHQSSHVDLRVSRIPAETLLDLACQQAGLEYVLVERGVLITTPARAARFLRDLPESVRNNWAAVRVVFPDMTPEILARPPLPAALPGQAKSDREVSDEETPEYLASGKALQDHIKSMLAKP